MSLRAQTHYLNFSRINATSYASLAEAVLILYALNVGADDLLISVIASFPYLSALFMPLGRHSMARRGAVSTISRAWVFRNLSAFLLVFVPLVQRLATPQLGLALFVLAAFGFFSFRGLGLTAFTPLVGEITQAENRGRFIAQNTLQSNLFYLGTMFGIVLLTHRYPSQSTFQGIVVFGGTMGIVAGWIISRIPESDQPLQSAREPLLGAWQFIKSTSSIRRLLPASACITTALMLTIPFSMLALKKGFLLTDHAALIFAALQLVGAIVSSYANTLLLDRVGPRPMLILYTVVLSGICLLWIVSPPSWIWTAGIVIFLLIGAANAGIQTSLSHYLLSTVSSEMIVSISMVMAIFSNTIAGLLGSGIGGGLLRLLNYHLPPGLMVYRIYFAVVLILTLPAIGMATRLQPVADRRVRDVLGILFSVRDWRALLTLQKLSELRTETHDRQILRKLEEIKSPLSESSLAAFLRSPRFLTRLRAIRALGTIDFGEATADLLIHELETGEFTTAYMAADILGEHRIRKAVAPLRAALESRDIFLQGKAMYALAQLADRDSFPRIVELFRQADNPRLILSGSQALVEMGETENLGLLLEKLFLPELADSVRDEILHGVSELCHAQDLFYAFYPKLRRNPAEQSHLTSFIDEHAQLQPINRRELLEFLSRFLNGDQPLIEALDLLPMRIKRTPCMQIWINFLAMNPRCDVSPVRLTLFLIVLDRYLKQTTPHAKFKLPIDFKNRSLVNNASTKKGKQGPEKN
ncbi:MFS transporter [candidate division KSB1 bacterium]|nr:MFS transporter [candidate division KSB1 bacterium]